MIDIWIVEYPEAETGEYPHCLRAFDSEYAAEQYRHQLTNKQYHTSAMWSMMHI